MDNRIWLLVLASAFGHALWNVAARKNSGDMGLLWLAKLAACAWLLPLAVFAAAAQQPFSLPPTALLCVLASGLIHAGYFYFLSRAYAQGEISVVYPIARGSGIGLTAFLGWVLLGEKITPLGAVGIALVFLGILALGSPALKKGGSGQGIGLALLTGATIVSYSLVDKIGVGHLDPLVYMAGHWLTSTLLLAPFVLRSFRGQLAARIADQRGTILMVALFAPGTYLLILHAYTLGPVSYIVAARESSVAIGALLGFVFLREPFTRIKLLAITLILSGLFLLKSS